MKITHPAERADLPTGTCCSFSTSFARDPVVWASRFWARTPAYVAAGDCCPAVRTPSSGPTNNIHWGWQPQWLITARRAITISDNNNKHQQQQQSSEHQSMRTSTKPSNSKTSMPHTTNVINDWILRVPMIMHIHITLATAYPKQTSHKTHRA